MDNQQVLEQVLRNYTKSDKDLYKSLDNISEAEMKEALKELNLADYTQRDSFYWELQVVMEKCVAENGGADDNERLAEIVVDKWNQSHKLTISTALVLTFMYTVNLKFPNSRKAFVSVCDGDLLSYNTFNSKPRLFIDLLLRFLICINSRQEHTLRTLEEIAPLLFNGIRKTDYYESIGRLGFRSKKGLNYGKMNAYRKTIGLDKLVYAEGMKTILLEALSDTEGSELLYSLKKELTDVVASENSNEVGEYFEVEDLFDTTASEINKPIANEPKEDEKPLYNSETVIVGNGEEVEDSNNNPIQSLVSSLENAISAVTFALTQATQLPETQAPFSDESAQQQLKIAEDEIKRLKLALEQEKEKVVNEEEKAYTKILQSIGGEKGNYLLSDLYEESQGKIPSNPEISAGRLVNLFSSLSLAIGLEEHNNFYKIGDIFTIQKDELIKKYRSVGPITSQSDEIQVKLLKLGWSINGKVVIQPLVEELKGEK